LISDIWVDVPTRTFQFKQGLLSFSARLGSSRDEDSVDILHNQAVSGEGAFEMLPASKIRVTDFRINERIDLIPHEE
jgi:hypothetical protein